MSNIKVLKANKKHKKFIICANKEINNVNDTEQTHGEVIYAIHRILGLKVKPIENLEMVTIEI